MTRAMLLLGADHPHLRAAASQRQRLERRGAAGDRSQHPERRGDRDVEAQIGFRHSTCVSRAAGAMSRFVLLQTPPSTYSRPPIRTGRTSRGPSTTPGRPRRRSRRAPPASRTRRAARSRGRRPRRAAGRRSARRCLGHAVVDRAERLVGARRAAQQRGAHAPRCRSSRATSAIGASGVAATPASRAASRATFCSVERDMPAAGRQLRRAFVRDVRGRPARPTSARAPSGGRFGRRGPLARDERRRDERPGRGPDRATRRSGSRGRWRPRCRRAGRSSMPRRACLRSRGRARRGP